MCLTEEFLNIVENNLLPAREKMGVKLAGCYRWFGACGGSGEIVTIWAIKNWAYWGELLKAECDANEFKVWKDRLTGLCSEWRSKFLIPVSYSFLH